MLLNFIYQLFCRIEIELASWMKQNTSNLAVSIQDGTKCNVCINYNSHAFNCCLVLAQRPFFMVATRLSTSFWEALDFLTISLYSSKSVKSCKSSTFVLYGNRKIISFVVLSIIMSIFFVKIGKKPLQFISDKFTPNPVEHYLFLLLLLTNPMR